MVHSILIFQGTTPCAVGMDLLRQIKVEIQQLAQRLETHSSPELQQRLTILQERIQFIALDVDGNQNYANNLPLNNSITKWQTGDFLHCSIPGSDLIRGIESGRYPGQFEDFNPQALGSLRSSNHAAGGARPNGYIAFEVNKEAVERKLRSCFEQTRIERSIHADVKDDRVRIILVSSSLGGFASGSCNSLKQLIWSIAHDLQIEIDFSCYLLIPGSMNNGKDRINSLAVTAALSKELVAIATERHSHRERQPGEPKLQPTHSRHVPTILLSDVNHAGKGLVLEDQISFASQLLLAIVATPLGSRRGSQAADFVVRGSELTTRGEPKSGISAGLSMIVLGRERLRSYAVSRLAKTVLSQQLKPATNKAIEQQLQDFVFQQRLLPEQLLHRLLDEPLEFGNSLTTTRVMGFIESYTQTLKGMDLLLQGEPRIWIALQQAIQPADEIEAVLEERLQATIASFQVVLSKHVGEQLQAEGLVTVRQFLTELRTGLSAIAIDAANTLLEFEADLAKQQATVEEIQTTTIPALQQLLHEQHSWFSDLVNGKKRKAMLTTRIQEASHHFLNRLKQLIRSWLKHRTQIAVVKTLEQLQTPVHQELAKIHQAEGIALDLHHQFEQNIAHVVAHNNRFACPNGLCLIQTLEDLKAYYSRILPEEAAAIAEVTRQIFQSSDVEFTHNQARQRLLSGVEALLQPKLNSLHVVTELRQRFPDNQELGSVLRQRDRESHEFIQLKDSCDSEHGVHVIRLLGIDQAQAGNLPDLLRQYGYQRGIPYEVVNTHDPDRILFLQERAVFPFTAWAHHRHALDAYRLISEATQFEKLHSRVGERFLTTPGQFLSPVEAQAIVVRAWLLGRIQPRSQSYAIEFAYDPFILLERSQAVLCSSQGYRYSVDIISHFSNFFLQRGAEFILERLHHLLGVRNGDVEPNDAIEKVVSRFLEDEPFTLLREQLEWWQQNIILQAMEQQS